MTSNRVLMVIPCAISSSRMVIGLAFPWLPMEWRMPAIAVAALTDLVDGPISRRLNVDGVVGQVLDPTADKIFIGGVLTTVVLEGSLAWWELLLAGARDLIVMIACVTLILVCGWASIKPMRARLLGKLTTGLQMALVLTVVAGFPALARVLLIPTALVGLLAVADYFLAFRRTNGSPRIEVESIASEPIRGENGQVRDPESDGAIGE